MELSDDENEEGAYEPSSSSADDEEEAISVAGADTTSPPRGERPASSEEEEFCPPHAANSMIVQSAVPSLPLAPADAPRANVAEKLPSAEKPPLEVFTFDATFHLGPNGGGDDVSAVQDRYMSEAVRAPSGDRWNVILLSHALPLAQQQQCPVARTWSAYLNIDGALLKPRQWYRRVRYTIEFVQHAPVADSSKLTRQGIDDFGRDHLDWGFQNIVTVSRDGLGVGGAVQHTVIDPALVDAMGLLTVRIGISVIEKWDSTLPLGRRAFERKCMGGIAEDECREMTGYVGLENQGATCYMNSLLQSFFHTRRLVEAVYQMPTSALGHASEEARQSVPLALQRVFSMLETKASAVSTMGLTESFGWDSAESFTQVSFYFAADMLCESSSHFDSLLLLFCLLVNILHAA